MIGLSPLKIPQSHIGLVQLTSFFISVAPAEISHPLKMAWAAPEAANVLSLLGGHTGDTECYTANSGESVMISSRSSRERGVGMIRLLSTHPEFMRKGCATALLDMAGKLYPDGLDVNCYESSLSFWVGRGFRIVRQCRDTSFFMSTVKHDEDRFFYETAPSDATVLLVRQLIANSRRNHGSRRTKAWIDKYFSRNHSFLSV